MVRFALEMWEEVEAPPRAANVPENYVCLVRLCAAGLELRVIKVDYS